MDDEFLRMIATVILSLVTTFSFCLCVRGFFWLLALERRPPYLISRNFSASAIRIGLSYFKFSLLVLAIFSLVGAIQSFIELFQLSI